MNINLEKQMFKFNDIKIANHSQIIINGERGKLECLYNSSGATSISSPVLMLFHPQPNSKGTMYNKILQQTMIIAAKMGFVVFTLNFGGVGNSCGKIEDGPGEFLDASSAFKWISDQHSYSRSKWVFGFSFGAYIAAQLTMRRPEIDGFIFVSTPLEIYDFSFFIPFPVTGLVVHASEDQIVKEYKILNFFGKNDRCNNINYSPILTKTNHFFQNIDYEKEIGFSIYHYLQKYSNHEFLRKIHEYEIMNHKKPFLNFEEYSSIRNFNFFDQNSEENFPQQSDDYYNIDARIMADEM
jgi:alpha/beta superfamily hydrolase